MSAALLNIVIGLATSVLSGGAVLIWRHVADAHIQRRKAAFFGLRPGGTCLIVLPDHWRHPGSTSHNDVHAMIEVATLAHEVGCPISVLSTDGVREFSEDRTEFCIGGPTSNPRTASHLASHLPGVSYRPYRLEPDPGAIIVGGKVFSMDQGNQEHVLVAKFFPAYSKNPIMVIYGQRAIDNRAAIHFLKRECRMLSKTVESADRFCLILRVISPATFGHQAAELVADVTDAAFADHRQTIPVRGTA